MYQGVKVQGIGLLSLQVVMLDSRAFPAGPYWGKSQVMVPEIKAGWDILARVNQHPCWYLDLLQ
jgi:hypothetical protein